MNAVRRIALKVDCDTFEGTKTGLSHLLNLFDKAGIKASFFFTLGPDRSGRAIRRVFTQKGFLKKMLRSNAVSLYGPKTMLYGTLLPSPNIGKQLKSEIHSVASAGHEVGVHAWDHIRWHDSLEHLTQEEIEHDYRQAHEAFEDIFGWKAHASAAPGWHATPTSLSIQERFGLLYASDTRGGYPYFPSAKNRIFNFLEIPTTLPTWDEALSDSRYRDRKALLDFYRKAIQGTEVHTIHTEVEGGAYASLFERQIDVWKTEGVSFISLKDLADETLKNRRAVPHREIHRIAIPNRAGLVSSGMNDAIASHP